MERDQNGERQRRQEVPDAFAQIVIDLSSYQPIQQVRFKLNASGKAGRLIDDVRANLGGTLTLFPTDDTFVTASSLNDNKGCASDLRVRRGTRESCVKFYVSGLFGCLGRAKTVLN